MRLFEGSKNSPKGCDVVRKVSHRNRSRHRNRVRNCFRDPYCAMSRNNPCAVAGVHCHDAARCIDQLIAIMKVQWDLVPGGVVVSVCDNARGFIRQPVQYGDLSLFRHLSSQ